jgi:hypothetical protein
MKRTADKSKRSKILVILIALTLIAGVIRGRELGKWCFTVDEYYFQKSVTFILEKGAPQLPDGGYYFRGLFVQYLTALSSLIFPDPEFAARIVPLIFGVLSVPLFFLICRFFLPTFPALLCSMILLFSSWHIEFSRFARMYAPFQFVFFLFIYFLYSGYILKNRTHQIYSWITAFFSVFIYEGAIFFPFILLLPIILDDAPLNRRTLGIILVFLLLLGVNYLASKFPYWGFRAENPYPPELIINKPAIAVPIFLPDSELLRAVWRSVPLVVGHLLCIMGGAYIYFKQLKYKRNFWEVIALTVAVSLPLLYQYGLLTYVLIFLFISHKSILHMFFEQRRYWILYFVSTISFWILVGMMGSPIAPGETIRHFGMKMVSLLFGYPRIYKAIFLPFLGVIPLWGTILLLGFIVSIFRYLYTDDVDSRRFIFLVLIVCVVMISTFKTLYVETRYCFFFFPLLYIPAYIETVFGAEFAVKYFERKEP